MPVLTVNERFGERAEAWSTFGRVLYPADLGGRNSQPVLHAAEDLTAEFGGRVEVVHVVEPIHTQTLQTPEGEILLPKDLQYQIKSRFQAQLSDIAHDVTRVPSCWQLIEDHKPGSGLMTYADRHAVDLIVLPALGRDPTRHTVLGSVDLGPEIKGLDGRNLRFRKLVIQPGGVVPWHSHGDRPALILTGTPADDELDLVTVLLHTTSLRGNCWELALFPG